MKAFIKQEGITDGDMDTASAYEDALLKKGLFLKLNIKDGRKLL